MKVLLVGAAGYVGTLLRPALEQVHQCQYFDRKPVPGGEDRTTVGDVNDDTAINAATKGVEAVIYLAMGVKPGTARDCWDTDAAFDVNIKAWYRFLFTGLKNGVCHFVYASTMSVYSRDILLGDCFLDEQTTPDAWDIYGVSKQLGERLCRAAAEQYPDATIIVLRMFRPRNDEDWQTFIARMAAKDDNHKCLGQGPDDLRRLYLAALDCRTHGAHIVQTTGDVKGDSMPNTRATELLGWAPQCS